MWEKIQSTLLFMSRNIATILIAPCCTHAFNWQVGYHHVTSSGNFPPSTLTLRKNTKCVTRNMNWWRQLRDKVIHIGLFLDTGYVCENHIMSEKFVRCDLLLSPPFLSSSSVIISCSSIMSSFKGLKSTQLDVSELRVSLESRKSNKSIVTTSSLTFYEYHTYTPQWCHRLSFSSSLHVSVVLFRLSRTLGKIPTFSSVAS